MSKDKNWPGHSPLKLKNELVVPSEVWNQEKYFYYPKSHFQIVNYSNRLK